LNNASPSLLVGVGIMGMHSKVTYGYLRLRRIKQLLKEKDFNNKKQELIHKK